MADSPVFGPSKPLLLLMRDHRRPVLSRAVVAQLVRAPDCGSGGRWFKPTQLYHSHRMMRSVFQLAASAAFALSRAVLCDLGAVSTDRHAAPAALVALADIE